MFKIIGYKNFKPVIKGSRYLVSIKSKTYSIEKYCNSLPDAVKYLDDIRSNKTDIEYYYITPEVK